MRALRLTPIVAIAMAFLLVFCIPIARAENQDITDAGDYLQIILPAVAGLSTLVAGNPEGGWVDREGLYQFTKSLSSSLVTMGIGKEVSKKLRPDASDRASHPSGHTTAAFAGAGFIDQRYGHGWGIPALLTAGFVGYSRIQSYNHFADDVVAGASIGMMYNWLFVTPQSESSNVFVLPMVVDGGYGLSLTVTDGVKTDAKAKRSAFKTPKFRFNFNFGPAFLGKNEITASSDTGTTFDLADFEKINDPTSTAAIDFEYYMNDCNTFSFYLAPYENRDRGTFSSPVSYDGKIFPADTTIYSDWLLYELRAGWQYNLTPAGPWDLKVGAALAYQYLETALTTASESVSGKVKENLFLPLLNATLNYHITPRFSAGIKAEGMYLSNNSSLEAGAFLNYRLTERWDFTAGYTYWQRNIDTSDIKNDVVYHAPYLGVAFSWL